MNGNPITEIDTGRGNLPLSCDLFQTLHISVFLKLEKEGATG